jgi:hypothetical protein
MTTTFRSPEVATAWRAIASSLDRLVEIAGSVTTEGLHWRPAAPAANSIAVLVRRRDEEFADRPVTAAQLADDWLELRTRLESALAAAPPEEMSGRDVLFVVARHAVEHLGQAELTRDLWAAQAARG